MQPTVDKVILMPRFSAFAGSGEFLTAPINVRPYGSGFFDFRKAGALGDTPAEAEVVVQQSPDLEIWEDVGDALEEGASDSREFRFEWIRLKVTVSGDDPGVTCWCVGDFVRRES